MADDPGPTRTPSARPGPGGEVPRWLLAGVAAAILLTLLAVVAAATRARYSQQLIPTPASGGLGGSAGAAVGQLGVTILLAIGELGIVAVLVFFPYRRRAHLGDPGAPPPLQLSRWTKVKMVALPFGLLAALILLLFLGLKRRRVPFHAHLAGGGSSVPTNLTRSTGSVNMGGDFLVASIGVLLVVLAVAATVYLRSRRHGTWRSAAAPEPSPPELPEELAGALAGGLDELSAGADPRAAVISAYVGMERALGERGLHRRHFETPLEYLERALAGLQASRSALARLTELFEAARFSPHPVDGGMRQEAEAALSQLRDELRA